jgi:hypothetical protein
VVNVKIVIDEVAVLQLLHSPNGPVAKDMLRRGRDVARLARRLVGRQSGRLAHSIEHYPVYDDGVPGVRIGSSLYYARFVHDGTGIYGPRGTPIRPTRKNLLAWMGRSRGVLRARSQFIYARSVRGQRGTKYLERALRAAG